MANIGIPIEEIIVTPKEIPVPGPLPPMPTPPVTTPELVPAA